MKPVKNFVFAVLLMSTLAFNSFAGDIETPGYVPPPPPRISVSDEESSTPVTDTDTQTEDVEPSDNLFFEALAALLSMY